MKKITSFCVDHRVLKPGLYISRVDKDVITYDMRVKKPNTGDLMTNVQMHTAEHMFATFIRNSRIAEDVLYFGPMGCQTGFYLLVRNTVSAGEVLTVICEILEQICAYDGPVFGASEVECGNYRSLNLEDAKTVCREYQACLSQLKTVLSYEEL